MLDELKRMKDRALQICAQMEWAEKVLNESAAQKAQLEEDLAAAKAAKSLISEAARSALSAAALRVNELGTLALRSVMDEDTSLRVELVERRNRLEADIFVEKDGNLTRPMTGSAGGEIDLIALALQVSFWAMEGRTRPILILDEPLKWLKGADLPSRGAEFMEKLSKELGVQFIIVSHITEQVEHSHVIEVLRDRNGTSVVKTSQQQEKEENE